MNKLILIDDDRLITEPLSKQLMQYGFDVEIAHNGRDGLALVRQNRPDLVILDILMPEMDGWAVCKALRAESAVPILMLTALGEEIDRILGLELGADDYLSKPFSSRELIARIKALLRRVKLDQAPVKQELIEIGHFRLELNNRQLFRDGQLLELRYKEFELLSLLMSRAGDLVSRADIFDLVWGTDWLGDTRTLDVHIRWLREKLEKDPSRPEYIQTVRGAGYRFKG